MTTSSQEALDKRKVSPVYLLREGEMLINAPVSTVWPLVVNYPSWQHYSTVKTVEGVPGREGEVVMLRKEEAGFVFPTYFARTIKIVPQRRIIWKTYIESGTPEIDRFGIVDFKLYEEGAVTRFTNSLLYEFLVPYEDERELEEFKRTQDKNFEGLQSTTYPRLKAMAEAAVSEHR